jgi:hypothetical protein
MNRFLGAMLVAVFTFGASSSIRADDKDTKAIIDKAIKALGGAEKLGKVTAMSWKSKGTVTFNGEDNEFTTESTLQGLDHYRSQFSGTFGGNEVKGVTVLNGDKGWNKRGEEDSMEMDADAITAEKRRIYLTVVPGLPVLLDAKGFKVESAPEEKVGDKPAVGLKVTGPDGKDFHLYFDKESGLPVRTVGEVVGFDGQPYKQDTTYSQHKDFDGFKRATKISAKRDGEKFVEIEITEFKVLDKVDPETFSQPK